MRYRNFSGYLRETYHCKIRKLCIDGGFTCPNRDGTCGTGGCIFCGDEGAGEHIPNRVLPVSEQVAGFFAHHPKEDGFIAYFQNFTNTYAPVAVLKEKYDAALADPRMTALAVGTRPDCITEEIAALLQSYTSRCDVWVELGLQTANDRTAERINRGYPREVFAQAVSILKQYGIPVVVHIIVGLPGEQLEDVRETVRYINTFHLWGIKLHSIFVMRNTVLEEMYRSGLYQPPTMEEYVEAALYVLTHISPDMIVHRLTGDCAPALLVAPEWNRDKEAVLAAINRALEAHGWEQGCFYYKSYAEDEV